MQLKKGTVLLCLGDSITDCHRDREDYDHLGNGYPKYLAEVLQHHQIKVLNRGISGDRTKHLLQRYVPDVFEIKPQAIIIFIGINDVWHYFKNGEYTDNKTFLNNYETLLQSIKNDLNIPILMVEPFIIYVNNELNKMYEELYQKFIIIRRLARKYASDYVTLDGVFSEKSLIQEPTFWSGDGIHPTQDGHKVIAHEIFKRIEIIE